MFKLMSLLFCCIALAGCRAAPSHAAHSHANDWSRTIDYTQIMKEVASEGLPTLDILHDLHNETQRYSVLKWTERVNYDKTGVKVYCTYSNVKDCTAALAYGSGVYIPLNDPKSYSMRSVEDLKKIDELPKRTSLEVVGVWYGPPNTEELDRVMRFAPRIAGVAVWWTGKDACPNKIVPPKLYIQRGLPMSWMRQASVLQFIAWERNSGCEEIRNMYSSNFQEVSTTRPWVVAVPCYDGNEWRCWRAIKNERADVCNSQVVRFMFSLHSLTSYTTLQKLVSRCNGKADFDIIEAI